jgi:polysaccharide biosynthesis/export protein
MLQAKHSVFALFLLLLASCSGLPSSGPDDAEIVAKSTASLSAPNDKPALQYALVNITRAVLRAAANWRQDSFVGSFGVGTKPAPEIRLGVGDVVQVTIFESQTGGLFVPQDAGSRPGNYVTLPQQVVDHNGRISVPYAGSIRVAGRTARQIQGDIEGRLKNRAIEPQAIVSIISQKATEVAVMGEVNSSNKFAVNSAGDRVLDVISKAGGIKYPGYETLVTLQRNGREATISFDELVRKPMENVYVVPGDAIYVARQQATFLAYGASGRNGKFDFASEKLSLAEAVAKAEGLLDDRADPRHVFLYRIEDRHVLQDSGVDLSSFPENASLIPTVYRLDVRDPSGFFVAQGFAMQDKDVIYVSNADSVELYKFLQLISAVPSTAHTVSYGIRETMP